MIDGRELGGEIWPGLRGRLCKRVRAERSRSASRRLIRSNAAVLRAPVFIQASVVRNSRKPNFSGKRRPQEGFSARNSHTVYPLSRGFSFTDAGDIVFGVRSGQTGRRQMSRCRSTVAGTSCYRLGRDARCTRSREDGRARIRDGDGRDRSVWRVGLTEASQHPRGSQSSRRRIILGRERAHRTDEAVRRLESIVLFLQLQQRKHLQSARRTKALPRWLPKRYPPAR